LKIYEKEFNSNEIEGELKLFKKPTKYEGSGYPYNDLEHRQFEILIYLIYEEEIKTGKYKGEYDKAHLMQAVGERGRDVLLTYKGNYRGVIQCKNQKDRLDKSEISREIIKFVLYYLKDQDLITDLNRFSYYLIAPKGFTEPGLQLLIKFNQKIIEEENLKKWTEKVIEKFTSLNDLKYEETQEDLIDILQKLKVDYKTESDIDNKLAVCKNVISQIFSVQKVIDEEHFKRLQREKPEPIDLTPRPDDERIPILEGLIKNFTIQYYKEEYPSSINRIIYQLLDIINRYRPRYLEKFAPNHSVDHQKIISNYFSNRYGKNLFPRIFKERINNEEITPEEVHKRDIVTHAGDLAYVVYEIYKEDFKKENLLINYARQKYENIIVAKHDFYKKKYWPNIFQESLNILEDNGIIKTTGPYTGSNCLEKYEICCKLERLKDYIKKYSLENLLITL